MDDTYTSYEKGLKQLLFNMGTKHPQYIETASLQTRMSESIKNLRMLGTNDPSERATLNQIMPQLHEICVETTGMNFNAYCELVSKQEQELAVATSDPLRPYIGDWMAVQEGRLNQHMIDELKERGIVPKTNRKIVSEDPLARYRSVPLHARILYTAQDQTMASYILEQWASLDSQSGQLCDIYHSNDQFYDVEDAYDFLYNSRILRESGVDIDQTDLPGMFFWDHDEVGEFISFNQCMNDAEITKLLRSIFTALKKTPDIEAVKRVKSTLS
jgi:hypothetical protein